MANAIYSDFDGTITKQDTVNAFLERFADASWKKSEELWVDGKITSRENALVQVGLIRSVTEKDLNEYLDSIELGDHFLDFYRYVDAHGIPFTILSDGFDLFIERTLKRYDLRNVRYYANHLIYRNNGFSIEFPHYAPACKIGAGLCKCSRILEDDYYYIGDGVTDLCVAKNAKVLFATKYLNEYCDKNEMPHVNFSDFGDIVDYLVNA